MATDARVKSGQTKANRVIDIDGHVLMECVPDWTSRFPPDEAQRLEERYSGSGLQGSPSMRHPSMRGTSREEIYESLRARNKSSGGWDPKVRLADMDTEGIDMAVLFGTELSIGQDAYSPEVCKGYNDWLAEYCQADPRRLKGVALVPVGDMKAARRELRRAVGKQGFVALFMKPSMEDKRCDSEYFHPLYDEAQDLNVPLMLHIPHGANHVISQRFHYDFVRMHAAMHPFGMMLAVMDVIYSGLLDRFPKLRIGFMEGQVGWLPWFIWRLDEQHEEYMHRPGMRSTLTMLPSEYVKQGRMFFSCDLEEKYLPFAAKNLGADHIVWASDYPHSDCIFPGAVKAFLDQKGMTQGQKGKILRDNSMALLFGEKGG